MQKKSDDNDDKLDQFKKQVSGVKMCVYPGKKSKVKCPVKGSFLIPVLKCDIPFNTESKFYLNEWHKEALPLKQIQYNTYF